MNVLFSVVIANYNYGRFIEDAILSVVTQCGRPVRCSDGICRLPLPSGEFVELIICDGNSTDESVEVIRKYEDSIAWWCSEKDKGQSDAFNKGFSHATGRFLTWLNADDIFTHEAFAAVRQIVVADNNCQWIVGSLTYTDPCLKVVKCFCAHRFFDFRARHGFLSVWGPSSFFAKELFDAVGGVETDLHYVMDIDLWHKFFLHGARYVRTRKNIFAYRRHEESKLSGLSFVQSEKNRENRRKALAEHDLINLRYGVFRDWRGKLSKWLNYSPIDALVATLRTVSWKGKDARRL